MSQYSRKFFLSTISMDGFLGFKPKQNKIQDNMDIAEQGAMCGLLKTLNLEWNSVICKVIDIDPAFLGDKVVKLLIDEIESPHLNYVELGYSETNEGIQCNTIVPNQNIFVKKENKITESDTIMIVGGVRGICSDIMKSIMGKADPSAKYIFVGRSKIRDIPSWASGCDDEKKLLKEATVQLKKKGKLNLKEVKKLVSDIIGAKEISKNISDMKKISKNISYHTCDVNNKVEISKLVESLSEQNKITGVVFAAGVLRDQLIHKKKLEELEFVYNTKVKGIKNILGSIKNELKHLVLFSSAAGFFGNIGQSDYAAANDVLNKIAHVYKSKYPETNVCSWGFGPVDSPGGMISKNPRLRENFEKMGVEIIPLHSGGSELIADMFYRTSDTQILYGNWLAPQKKIHLPEKISIHKTIKLKDNTFLNDHEIKGKKVLPLTVTCQYLVDLFLSVYTNFKVYQIHDLKVFKGINLLEETNLRIDIEKFKNEKDMYNINLFYIDDGKIIPSYKLTVVSKLLNNNNHNKQFITLKKTTFKNKDNKIYGKYKSLFHGPGFQIIDSINHLDGASITIKLKNKKQDVSTLGDFQINTNDHIRLDACYQAMLIFIEENHGSFSVPLSFKSLTKYEDIDICKINEDIYISCVNIEKKNRCVFADIYMFTKSSLLCVTEKASFSIY